MPTPPIKKVQPPSALKRAIAGRPAATDDTRVHDNWVGAEELLTDDPAQRARLRRAFFKRRYTGFEDTQK